MRVQLAPFRSMHGGGALQESLAFPLAPGQVPLPGTWRLRHPVQVRVEVSGDARAVEMHAAADLDLSCPCDRCLSDVALHLPVAYAEEWSLAAAGPPESDDADVVRRRVSGDAVEIDDGFWQNVVLELPAKVLCAEACRGLCPQCGADLNATACACRPAVADPRMEGLAAWRPVQRP